MTDCPRDRESGVVLVNVLVVLTLASILVYMMLSDQDLAIARARNMASASAADALARGAEASVVSALRRDAEDHPETDHYGEEWMQVGQQVVELETGTFSVSVTDAQARLDVGRLKSGNVQESQVFLRLLAVLDLPPALVPRIASELLQSPDVTSLDALTSIDAATKEILDPHVDLLPIPSALNLNTASETLLAVVLNNPSAATRLIASRNRNGFLDAAAFADIGVIQPPGTGFTSNTFDAQIEAEVDETGIVLSSRMHRDQRGDVRVIRRRYGATPPAQLPPPPDK
jgi:general secretion pathway protein K